MFGIENFGAFVATGILLNMTPGAGTMYILGKSLSGGTKSGVISVMGICTGSAMHTLLTAFGLSALLAESQLAFDIVKYLGAIYLIGLGCKLIFSNKKMEGVHVSKKESYKKIYLSGALTNLLNPKVALFYIAFLPQFVNPEFEMPLLSFLILGFTYVFTGVLWCTLLAIFSARFSEKIQQNQKIKKWLDKISGVVFVSFGIKLAISK
ncbi:LysE family translocator [Aquimarina sp. TRL1]|nr:LysE family translocator [Aquimarina sp. TRL1]